MRWVLSEANVNVLCHTLVLRSKRLTSLKGHSNICSNLLPTMIYKKLDVDYWLSGNFTLPADPPAK